MNKTTDPYANNSTLSQDVTNSQPVTNSDQSNPVEIDQLRELQTLLSLIRDREDCPENIVEMIDDIRYSDFFNEIYDEEL